MFIQYEIHWQHLNERSYYGHGILCPPLYGIRKMCDIRVCFFLGPNPKAFIVSVSIRPSSCFVFHKYFLVCLVFIIGASRILAWVKAIIIWFYEPKYCLQLCDLCIWRPIILSEIGVLFFPLHFERLYCSFYIAVSLMSYIDSFRGIVCICINHKMFLFRFFYEFANFAKTYWCPVSS